MKKTTKKAAKKKPSTPIRRFVRIKNFKERPKNWNSDGEMDHCGGAILEVNESIGLSTGSEAGVRTLQPIYASKKCDWVFGKGQYTESTQEAFEKYWKKQAQSLEKVMGIFFPMVEEYGVPDDRSLKFMAVINAEFDKLRG